MGFKFSEIKRICRIEIEGEIYPVEITEDLGKKLKNLGVTKPINAEGEKGAAMYVDGLIDSILGYGKAAHIFAGRPIDVFEHVEVLQYICDEITAAVNKRIGSIKHV